MIRQHKLTGLEDIDYHILMSMEFKELRNQCRTNKYVHNVCCKKFWKDKIKYDNLLAPDKKLLKKGMKSYYTCYTITNLLKNNTFVLYINKPWVVSKLCKKYSIEHQKIRTSNKLNIQKVNDNYCVTVMYFDTTVNEVNYKEKYFINFLYKGLYKNNLTKIHN